MYINTVQAQQKSCIMHHASMLPAACIILSDFLRQHPHSMLNEHRMSCLSVLRRHGLAIHSITHSA